MLALVAAACGDDDNEGTSATTGGAATTAAATTTPAASTSSSATGGASTSAGASTGSTTPPAAISPSGNGSKDLGSFKLGVINSNDNFPEYSAGIEAAVKYVNGELNGLDGRQIDLQVCSIEYNTPDDTQRCANELASAQVDFGVSTLNQFGTHMQILRGAGIPVLVGTPVSVPDYTTQGVYAISPGGGCAGTVTALVKYAAQELHAKKIAIPYADIPSGVLCYADSEQKPVDVLNGSEPGSSPDAGSIPDLERKGVPIPPQNPDMTAIANQILDFKPDAVILSSPATTCWPLLAALNAVGYSVKDTPFVMGTSCFNQANATDAGDNAVGITFVGSGGYLTRDPAQLEGQRAIDAKVYQEKGKQYGLTDQQLSQGFAQQGFIVVMSMLERAQEVAAKGNQVEGKSLADAFAATKDNVQFGSTPISCSTAPAPYISVCNGKVNVTQWDGKQLQPVISDYYAMDLLEGTKIRTQPQD